MTILGKDDSYEDDGLKTTFPILVLRTSKGHGELRFRGDGCTVLRSKVGPIRNDPFLEEEKKQFAVSNLAY